MATIELQYGGTSASIDLNGAWLTRLVDESGDVLYPRYELKDDNGDKKMRGGMHVCVPNFGPGGRSDQPQHGFGRTMEWKLVGHEPDYASMILQNGEGSYKNLSSMISFELDTRAITIMLSLINRNDYPIHVAPGFHPYFVSAEGSEVTLDDKLLDVDNLIGTEFINGTVHELEVNRRQITLESNELTRWALWTDRLGPYVCVEPTVSGFAFQRPHPPETEMLAPDEQRTYTFSMSW